MGSVPAALQWCGETVACPVGRQLWPSPAVHPTPLALPIAASEPPAHPYPQGPPGTGKTRTLLAFIQVLVEAVSDSALARKRQGAILAVGDTNAAADNLLEGLLERGINVVRCRGCWAGVGPSSVSGWQRWLLVGMPAADSKMWHACLVVPEP